MLRPRQPTVAVVGGGVYGWAAALRLSELGARVTLHDPLDPGAPGSSSGGLSRILRYEYGGDRLYPELTLLSLPLWRDLARRAGRELFRQVGVLLMVPEGDDGEWERFSLEVDAAVGVPASELSASELRRRWPSISTGGIAWGLHSEHGGILHAAVAVRAIADLATAAGVVHVHERVIALEGGLVVAAGGGRARYDQVLLATGAFTGALAPSLGVVPTRQVSVHLSRGPGRIPVFGEGAPFSYYGFPAYAGAGFKIGIHVTGPEGDPVDPAQRRATAAEIARLVEQAARRFPETAGAEVGSADVCFYEMTGSGDPVVARLDDHTVACTGFSGHGFKFAPVVAAAAGDLVLGGSPAIPLDRFAP